MTSNLGSEYILHNEKDKAEELLHRTFKPEFLNRIDEIVYFNPLNKDVQYKIVDKMLNELKKRLEGQFYLVEFSSALRKFVIDSAYSSSFGARPLKRFIQDKIETALANAIIKGEIDTKSKFLVDVKGNEITITKE